MTLSIKDGLYNYFSQSYTRRLKILLLVFVFILAILLYFFADTIFNDQNLYYYTFSTIVQGFLALVALLGAVVIYKLQIIEAELNNIRDRIENDLTYFIGKEAYSFSWTECINEAKRLIDNFDPTKQSGKKEIERIEMNWKKLDRLNNERRSIRSKMIDFSFLSFLNIGLALVLLPISKLILVNNLYFLAEIFILGNIIISCISMIFAFKIIRLVLGYDFKVHL